MNTHQNFKKYFLFCIALLCIAAGLRFYNLNGTCLWLDEAVNANNAIGSFSEVLSNTRKNNSAPILLPLTLWAIQDYISEPWVARIFPALFGLGAVFVCLIFPFAGISKQVSALCGIALCFSPIQIQYSQEVREYSAGVFLSALLLFFFMLYQRGKLKNFALGGVSVCVGLSPFVTYGVIFIAAVLIAMLCLDSFLKKTNLIWAGFICVIFVWSMRYSYLLTAIYQQGVAQSWHLAAFYPNGSIERQVSWLFTSVIDFIDFNVGVNGSAFVLFCIAGASLSMSSINKGIKNRGAIIAFVLLLLLLVMLAFVKKYPFGGARQVLFASPLVVLVFAVFLEKIRIAFCAKKWFFVFIVSTWLVMTCVVKLPNVYADPQDVIEPLSMIPDGIQDESVYIDAWAVPSVNYHFRDRKFFKCSQHPDRFTEIADEINNLPGGRIFVFISERPNDEIQRIQNLLSETNSEVNLVSKFQEYDERHSAVLTVKK